MDPKISVIVPIYNCQDYLEKCVHSIREQTYTNLEIILIDDGSTDRSGYLCDKYTREDSRIRVRHKPNAGISSARNKGLEIATGEYISFVDSDDWLEKDMIDTLYQSLVSNNAYISCCNFIRIGTDGQETTKRPTIHPGLWSKDDFWRHYFTTDVKTYCDVVWNKLYKKEVFDGVRFPVGKINEDRYIMHFLVEKSQRIAVTDAAKYYYLQRDDSIMHQAKSLKNLVNPEAYLMRSEYFYSKAELHYSEEALSCCIHEIQLGEFGPGWRQSPEYKKLKKSARNIFMKLFPHLSLKRKISMLLFFFNEPLSRVFRSIYLSSSRKK